MEGIDTIFNCWVATLGISLVPAWPGLYFLWTKELRGRPVFADRMQPLRWLTWLTLLLLLAFATIIVVGFTIAALGDGWPL